MRSLADDLRSRSGDELAALLSARPDLLRPVPADITALAQRAGSPPSVSACLRGYDQLALHVALAAALGPDPVRPAALTREVAAHVPGPGALAKVRAAVAQLRAHALLWGTGSLHLVGPARDLMVPADRGPRLAALDQVVAAYAREPESLHALLGSAPTGVPAVLERLLSGPVIGSVADVRRDPVPDRSPVDWMLAHHILVPFGADHAVLPAEVVTILRGSQGGARDVIDLAEPTPANPGPDPARVDSGAVGFFWACWNRMGGVARGWASSPPARLRTGGIPARDLTRTARALGAAEAVTALLIEVAAGAGLLATDSHDQVSVLPTIAFDTWAAGSPSEQHATLLEAWLGMPRAVAGPGQRPLAPELASPTSPDLRRDILRVLASASGAWTDDEVTAAVDWRAPRRHDASRAERVRAILWQCRELGLLVGGTLSSAGQALLGAHPALVAALEGSLPERVDTLILQSDLTAIVPGLPSPALAELMRAMADPESTGAASTYRFSAESIRRALDSGRTATDLLGELSRRGSVPQPLAYLIEDVGRRHAVLRIGSAATFLRCDDPAVLAGILADPGATALGLFTLSDTVLASDQPPELVLDQVRRLGHTPLPEPGRGPATRGPRRARGRASTDEAATAAVTPALVAAAVRAIRANDRAEGAPFARPAPTSSGARSRGDAGGREAVDPTPGGADSHSPDSPSASLAGAASAVPAQHPIPTMQPAEVAAVLRAAIAAESPVWIGYADPSGVTDDCRIEPLRLAGGYLTALDLRSQAITSFALARITGAQAA